MKIRNAMAFLAILAAAGNAAAARAQHCHRDGMDVSCDDGYRGILVGGYDHLAGRHEVAALASPERRRGNKSPVTIGPGVFVGQGKGMARSMIPASRAASPSTA